MTSAVIPYDCASSARCLEATGGEQGLTADELERFRSDVADLRRELAELKREGDAIHTELTRIGCRLVAEVLRATKGGGQ